MIDRLQIACGLQIIEFLYQIDFCTLLNFFLAHTHHHHTVCLLNCPALLLSTQRVDFFVLTTLGQFSFALLESLDLGSWSWSPDPFFALRPSPPKNQVSWTFANHVRTFCYANGQVRRDGNSAVDTPQHQAGASPLHHDVGEG
jgi:hypothetical protein